jgi:hypothetical protein
MNCRGCSGCEPNAGKAVLTLVEVAVLLAVAAAVVSDVSAPAVVRWRVPRAATPVTA